mmetsp:Transcript_18867/g.25790  ORF Transcript_18867/g.25790 Transcript_18867/m.25790 type:complete len:1085 (+) Transcript_18867:86-3340(+)
MSKREVKSTFWKCEHCGMDKNDMLEGDKCIKCENDAPYVIINALKGDEGEISKNEETCKESDEKDSIAHPESELHPESEVNSKTRILKDSKRDSTTAIQEVLPVSFEDREKYELLQEMKDVGIDDEVCNALSSNDFLSLEGLAYVLENDEKGIAELLQVKLGKVIPQKFSRKIEPILARRQGKNTSHREVNTTTPTTANEKLQSVAVKEKFQSTVVASEKLAVKEKANYWICIQCTFHNSYEYSSCEMCNVLREGVYPNSTPEYFKQSKVPSSPEPFRSTTVDSNIKKQLHPQASIATTSTDRVTKYNNQQQPLNRNDAVLKPIFFDYPFNRQYYLLYSTQSQYSMGAVSACTTMAVTAALTLLKDTHGHEKPFGCSSEMIDGILIKGSKYKSVSHQDIDDVMRANPLLNDSLHHITGDFSPSGMVDVNLSDPVKALGIGNSLKSKLKANYHVCAIVTSQAQTVCIFYHQYLDEVILFDSHTRQYNGHTHGAVLLFFADLNDLAAYLKVIFPKVDQPDIRYQSEMEQLQFAQLSVAQADFFCLRSALEVGSNPVINIREPSAPVAIAVPTSTPHMASSHYPYDSPQIHRNATFATATPEHTDYNANSVYPNQHFGNQHSSYSNQHYRSTPQNDTGKANVDWVKIVDNLHDRIFVLQEKLEKITIEKTRCEETMKNQQAQFGRTIRDKSDKLETFENRIKKLEAENARLRNDKIRHPQQAGRGHAGRGHNKHPATIAHAKNANRNPPAQPAGAPHAKSSNSNSPPEKLSSKSSHDEDFLLAQRLYAQEQNLNDDYEYARQYQEQQDRLSWSDAEIARKMAADADMAQQDADAEAERQRALEEDIEYVQKFYAEDSFKCILCLEDVSVEDKFDLEHDNHLLCRECSMGYVDNAVRERVVPVKCPFLKCGYILGESKCFEVLNEELHQTWMDLSRRPHLDPAFRQCPVADCKGFDLLEDVNGCECTCLICRHRWCSNCQVDMEESQHKGITCAKYQEWKKDNDTGDDQMEEFLRKGLNDPDGEFRMRRCPRCRTAFMKDKACMHVTCERLGGGCGAHFCFRCGGFSADDAQAIYNHQGTCPGFVAGV